MNVFTMPFLCTDSGLWRKMSRAWPPVSVITTSSGTTCPSHHESALRDICQASWMLPTSTMDRKRTTNQRLKAVWWVEGFALCFLGVCIGGWVIVEVVRKGMWVNVFTMPFLCADSGQWRKMSRAWSAMSMITTSSVTMWPNHQESTWGAAEARQERVIVEVVRKGIIARQCSIICWTHLQMFFVSTVLGAVLWSICQACWPSPTSTLNRKRTTKWRRHVWCVEGFALCVRSVHGSMGRDVWVNVFPMPTSTLDRKRTTKWRRHVWCVEGFALCVRSVHGVDGKGCVSECLSNAILVHRLDHGERSQAITTSSGTIRLTQPGVIGLLATEVQKTKQRRKTQSAPKEKQ